MKTENEIEEAILKITMKINTEYPELSKYLEEMPVTIPDIKNPEINIKILQDYYNSLDSILKKYSPK
jgi:AAA15 family ATPase/GTPase